MRPYSNEVKGYPESPLGNGIDPTPKKIFARYTFVKLDLLFSTLKAPGHQIVWFGDPNLTYPNKDYEELSNGV